MIEIQIASIGLRWKGFTHTEMMDWDDETREWYYEQTEEMRKKEEEEARKAKSKGRSGRGRRR